MKRIIKSLIFLTIAAVVLLSSGGCREKTPRMYYEIKIYDVSGPGQAERTEKYIAGALKPVLRRSGIEGVGVFKPVETDTADFGKYIYVFIPYETADKYFSMKVVLEKDADYQRRAGDFLNASPDDPPFQRYESILLKAFEGMPRFRAPSFDTDRQERIYELRSYETGMVAGVGAVVVPFGHVLERGAAGDERRLRGHAGRWSSRRHCRPRFLLSRQETVALLSLQVFGGKIRRGVCQRLQFLLAARKE